MTILYSNEFNGDFDAPIEEGNLLTVTMAMHVILCASEDFLRRSARRAEAKNDEFCKITPKRLRALYYLAFRYYLRKYGHPYTDSKEIFEVKEDGIYSQNLEKVLESIKDKEISASFSPDTGVSLKFALMFKDSHGNIVTRFSLLPEYEELSEIGFEVLLETVNRYKKYSDDSLCELVKSLPENKSFERNNVLGLLGYSKDFEYLDGVSADVLALQMDYIMGNPLNDAADTNVAVKVR